MYEDIEDVASDIDHICHIDCQLTVRPDGGRSHMMHSTSPTSAAGRYQFDRNHDIYRMGKGARAAMRATGQGDTRTNREWSYGRKLWYAAKVDIADVPASAARVDRLYMQGANLAFGTDRRPFRARDIRKNARAARHIADVIGKRRLFSQAVIDSIISRPAYLPQSEHDPNL